MTYNPSDFIYYAMVQEVLEDEDNILEDGISLTLENAEEIFNNPEEFFKEGYYEDCFYDIPMEFREHTEECNLQPITYSRHYEIDFHVQEFTGMTESGKEVSRWVGWDYLYGGGKHAEPEAFDWIGNSVFVNVVSEEVVTVVKRTFERE